MRLSDMLAEENDKQIERENSFKNKRSFEESDEGPKLRSNDFETRMTQTRDYREGQSSPTPDTSKDSKDKNNEEVNEEERKENKKSFIPKNMKVLYIGGAVIVVLLLFIAFIIFSPKKEQKAKFMDEETVQFGYSSEEIQELRDNGYTGSEIEMFESEEIPAQEKIQEAKESREAKYDKEIKPLFDSASPEYLELLDKTWLGQKDINLNIPVEEWTNNYTTRNLDYDKLPAKGFQCMIRLHLNDKGGYAFMTISPQRYIELAESGNINVKMEFQKIGNRNVLLSMEEVRID